MIRIIRMRMMKMRTRIVAGDDKDEEDEGYGYDLYKIAPPKHKLCSGGEGPNNACKNLVEPLLVDSTKVCELQSWGGHSEESLHDRKQSLLCPLCP